jgi:protoheme IX farnesyltransferase
MSDTLDILVESSVVRGRSAAFVELCKPRIATLVLVATAVGFCMAPPPAIGGAFLGLLAFTLVGTGLVACGANSLNQLIEAAHDARMERTRNRPIPTGRLTRTEVLVFGLVTGVAGVVLLALTTNVLAAAVAAATFVSYVGVYTPLKRVTSYSVFVGAVPGALPPVIGWAAAEGAISLTAVLLFAIVFFWQLPHFLAIAWLYREDYARAGYPVVPVVDTDGTRTDFEMITHSVALLFASLLPVIHGVAGATYAGAAVLMGLGFLACGAMFLRIRTPMAARCHLLASIVYLPLLLGMMMIDKV